jgi:hypothetical protein
MKAFLRTLSVLFVTLALFACGGVDSSGDENQSLAETESEIVVYGEWAAGTHCRIGDLYCPPIGGGTSPDCDVCDGPFVGPNGCFMVCGGVIVSGTIVRTPIRAR